MDAARKVFCSVGYVQATMSDIAASAGMSKKTLYQLFPSKAALFVELVRADPIVPPEAILEAGDDVPIEEVLVEYLHALAMIMLSPNSIAIQRLVIGAAHRDPELAAAFQREIVQDAPRPLLAWLARQNDAGRLAIDDPDEAQAILFGVAVAKTHCQMLFNPAESVCEDEIRGRIRRGVKLFLAGYGARA